VSSPHSYRFVEREAWNGFFNNAFGLKGHKYELEQFCGSDRIIV